MPHVTAPVQTESNVARSTTGAQANTSVNHDSTLDNDLMSATGEEWQDVVDAISVDPTVTLIQELSLAPYVAGIWSIDEKEDAPEGAAEFILAELDKHKLNLLTSIVNGHHEWGWAPFEKIFGVKDGHWIIDSYKPLLQAYSTLQVDKQTGEIIGLEQSSFNNNSKSEIDVAKLFYSAQNVRGQNWYGRPTYKTLEKTMVSYYATDDAACKYDQKVAGSHWVVKYPVGDSPFRNDPSVDNYDIANAILDALVASGGVVIPQSVLAEVSDLDNPGTTAQWDVSILSDSGSTAASFDTRLNYLDKQKVRSFGWPERSVLEGQFGTKAEAGEHGDFALLNVEIKHGRVVEDLNKQVVAQLMSWNYGEESVDSIRLKVSPLTDASKAILKTLLDKIMSNQSLAVEFAHDVDFQQMRDTLNIPTDENAEAILPELEPVEREIEDNGSERPIEEIEPESI